MSKLPEDLKSFRPAKKILAKLQKFGENLDLRIRPHVLLKVLQELRIWELCSPDVAVAIEVTTPSPPLPMPRCLQLSPRRPQGDTVSRGHEDPRPRGAHGPQNYRVTLVVQPQGTLGPTSVMSPGSLEAPRTVVRRRTPHPASDSAAPGGGGMAALRLPSLAADPASHVSGATHTRRKSEAPRFKANQWAPALARTIGEGDF